MLVIFFWSTQSYAVFVHVCSDWGFWLGRFFLPRRWCEWSDDSTCKSSIDESIQFINGLKFMECWTITTKRIKVGAGKRMLGCFSRKCVPQNIRIWKRLKSLWDFASSTRRESHQEFMFPVEAYCGGLHRGGTVFGPWAPKWWGEVLGENDGSWFEKIWMTIM